MEMLHLWERLLPLPSCCYTCHMDGFPPHHHLGPLPLLWWLWSCWLEKDAGGRVGTSPPISTSPVDAASAAAAVSAPVASAAVASALASAAVVAAMAVAVAVDTAAVAAMAAGEDPWCRAWNIHYCQKGSALPLEAVSPAFDPGPASFPASSQRISGS